MGFGLFGDDGIFGDNDLLRVGLGIGTLGGSELLNAGMGLVDNLAGPGAEGAAQFRPDSSQVESDIGFIRGMRDRPIGGLTQAGQAEMGLLDQDRSKALDDLRAAQAGRLGTSQSQMALSGGLTRGASERMARQSETQGGLFAQGLMGDFAREKAGIAARNLGTQEELQNRAAFATPALSQGLFAQQAGIDAANAQSRAAADAGRRQFFGDLIGGGLSLFGMGMG